MANEEGWKSAEFILEQEVIARWRGGKSTRITLRVSKPELAKDSHGELSWECWWLIDGLLDPPCQPVREVSSFRALVGALDDIRILIRDELKGTRLFLTGGDVLGDELFPDDGMSLAELFMRD